MGQADDTRVRIAIIGGGAAGTITACELAAIDANLDVEIIERRGDVGPGLAYSTLDPHHVVNVWAGRLSAVADDPDHLLRWLEARGEDARAEAFPQRRTYGSYLRELLAARIANAQHTRVRVVAATARRLRRDDGYVVQLAGADGTLEQRRYDAVVVALGNVDAPPALELPSDARCFTSPWSPGALDADGLRNGGAVLVVGTGLTAVDAMLSLADAAPGITIVAASRNGRLPFAHLPGPLRAPAPIDGFPTDVTSLEQLSDAWRAHLARASAAGFDWRDAVDGLRPITQRLWCSLDEAAQGRFLVEWRRWWEARRNRAAPQVGARLDELVRGGRLQVLAGHVRVLDAASRGLHVRVGEVERRVDRVICCTGPTADIRRTTNPLLRDLLATGIASPDRHLLGIRTGPAGELVDATGEPDPTLYTLGWLRRGELWETLAIPEIREQARSIAQRLSAQRLSAQR